MIEIGETSTDLLRFILLRKVQRIQTSMSGSFNFKIRQAESRIIGKNFGGCWNCSDFGIVPEWVEQGRGIVLLLNI